MTQHPFSVLNKTSNHETPYITVKGSRFYKGNDVYHVKGANYWQGMNLATSAIMHLKEHQSNSGNNNHYHRRLLQELDQLQTLGVNNLRIMAGSEGPDTEPYRMRPALQPSPGKYNLDVLDGLDYLLFEMKKRDMTAVMVLSNFWQFSGGFAQYIAWTASPPGSITIPYPITRDKWDEYEQFTKGFYSNTEANDMFKHHVQFIQTRYNKYTGKVYNEDPVIMSWQIANEPQLPPKSWIKDISSFIKQGSPHQLVCSGMEAKYDLQDFLNAHDLDTIDYCTCHCWPENWNIYDPFKENDLPKAIHFARQFITKIHDEWIPQLQAKEGKPLVVEEFGLARDAWRYPSEPDKKYNPETPTTHRDQYLREGIYEVIEKKLNGESGTCYFGGSNFWGYSGLGRPTDRPDSYGMVWVGDPPHEPKGWYSIYDKDSTTLVVIHKHFYAISDRSINTVCKGAGTD